MARTLLVDDDADQLECRRLLLEAAGHQVATACAAAAAYELFCASEPELVIMDLRLPRTDDGLALIRRLRERSPAVKILILSGWACELAGRPESGMVDGLLRKPTGSGELLRWISRLILGLFCTLALAPGRCPALAAGRGFGPAGVRGAGVRTFTFRLSEPAEVVAYLEMSSPGSDWGAAGREAAMALVTLDEAKRQHVMLYAGPASHVYSIFLGSLAAGSHQLRIERDAAHSAAGSGLAIAGARFREIRAGDPYFTALAQAPVLHAREDTIGGFSDVPMLVYCERLEEDRQPVLQYTVIFSNEDGGTSTRALMARWGRATDIEYVYKAYLATEGKPARATIQSKDHKEIEFRGTCEGAHPLLWVVTRNNMVAGEGRSAVRYQIAPRPVDLAGHSREQVMDENPFAYRVMAQELQREGKLRGFGMVEDEKISDPRNYLYLEAKVSNRDSGLAVLVRLEGESKWCSSNLGRLDYAIPRNGWIRTTLELPPGTKPSQIRELGFQCVVAPREVKGKRIWPETGVCRVEAAPRTFLLEPDYRPGPNVWSLPADESPAEVPTGEMRVFRR